MWVQTLQQIQTKILLLLSDGKIPFVFFCGSKEFYEKNSYLDKDNLELSAMNNELT